MNKPLRILQIVIQTDRGGLESFIMNVYRNIDREKIQFDFLKHRDTPGHFDEEIKRLGGKIYSVCSINSRTLFGQYQKELKCFLNQHHYEVIHSHINTLSGFCLEIAASEGIKRRIAHSHISYKKGNDQSQIKSIVKEYSKRKVWNFATNCFACSEDAGKWLFRELPFKVINNAIDCEKFKYDLEKRKKRRSELNLNEKFVIGHIGRFDEQKNHIFLIDVFNEIYQLNKDARLLLVGDGKLKESIEEKVKKLGLEDVVIFTGVRDDVSELLQVMDVFLFPSLFEGLGIVLIEAQANGLICVISDDIPKEVEVTNLIKRISLDDKPEKWAKIILSNTIQRRNTCNEVMSAGYDIYQTTKLLEVFYLNENG